MEMTTEKPLQEVANSKAEDRMSLSIRRLFDDGLSIVGDKICFPVAIEKKREKKDETQILTFGGHSRHFQ